MKILTAGAEHKNVIEDFLTDRELGGVRVPSFQEAETVLASHSEDSLLLVTDHVRIPEELTALYDYPQLGDDLLVGIVTITREYADHDTLYPGEGLAHYANLYMAPEYHNEVNLVLVLQDLVNSVVSCGMPYKRLWLPQAREGDGGDATLVKALTLTDIATGYVHEITGVCGHLIDLRTAHSLWSALSRRQREE